MCGKGDRGIVPYTDLSRRRFAALAAAATGLAVTGCATARPGPPAIAEREVTVTTLDGTAEAALFHPQGSGSWPGVLFWPDIGGLRPAMRDMGRRLAGSGYTVLVVNPFYRAATVAQVQALDRDGRMALRSTFTPGGVTRDADAFVTYLDGLPQTSDAKVGTQGYCMGGPLAFRTADVRPDRVAAVGSFHGGGLVVAGTNSPHLMIGRSNARYLVAIARNDDAKEPEAKTTLRQTFASTGRSAVVEVYDGDHGWCVPDNAAYNPAEAERAWAALLELYRTALV